MKKLIYLLMTAFCATMFTACSDDDKNDTPINGLEIPKFENPVKPGASVTIKGEGFTTASEIWFRQIVTKATGDDDVKAEVTGVDASGITFIAPSVYGNQTVLLKQDGREYKLGEMLFADEPADVEILPKKIKRVLNYGYEDGRLDYSTEYDYDYDADGRIISRKWSNEEIDKYFYSGNKITLKYDEGEFNFILENGRIKSYSFIDDDCDEENGTLTYEGGYLNKVNGVWKDDYVEEAFTETFTFLNGNMEKYEYIKGDEVYAIEFIYGNQLNNLNLDLFYFFDVFGDCIVEALPLGMTGERSRYLPSSMKISERGDEGTETYTLKVEYEMDGEYITKFTLKFDDGDTDTYVIEYE